MLHAPSEYYVKYLCSQPGTVVAQVQKLLAESGIGSFLPSSSYVEDIWKKIQNNLPINYNPRDPTHKPTQDFLKAHGIRGMWHPTHAVREATDLFSNGPVRQIIESLMLTGLDDSRIALVLTSTANVGVTPNAIAEYRHFFWNTQLLSYQEWTEYLTKPSVEPVRLAALRAPRNMDGVKLTLYKLNIMPKALDKRDVFSSIRDIGFMNFLEANGFPQGFRKAEMLSNYAGLIKGAQQQLDEYDAGEQDVIHDFYKRMTMKSRVVEHKTLDELRGEEDGKEPRQLTDGES